MAKKKQSSPKQKPKQAPKEESKATVGRRFWAKRFYIPGFGFVDVGDEASKEALAAWTKKTKVKVEDYLTE